MGGETSGRLMLVLLAIGLAVGVAGAVIVIGAVSAVFAPLPILLVAGAGFVFLAFHQPKWALLFTYATMPFERMMALFPGDSASTQSFLQTLTVTKLMLAVVIPVWLLRVLVLKDSSPFRRTFATPIPAVALAFAFYTTISLVNASYVGSYLKNQVTLVSNVVLFILALNVFDDKRWILRVVKVLFAGYVCVGLMGVYEVETQTHVLELIGNPMPEEAFVMYGKAFRPAGPSGDPDYFATSILFGFMLTLALWQFVRRRWLWVPLTLLLGVFLFDIFATGSRGAMLAFIVGMAVFWFFLETPYKVPVAAVALVAVFAVFAAYSVLVSGRTAGRYAGGETKSLEYRLGWQKQSFGMIGYNPVFGVGTGNNLVNQHRFFDPRPPRKPENTANTYAQLASEAGIPAALLFIAFYLMVLLYLLKVVLHADDPELRHLATSLLAMLAAFFVFAATAHGLYIELMWSFLAFSVSVGLAARDRRTPAG